MLEAESRREKEIEIEGENERTKKSERKQGLAKFVVKFLIMESQV